ncbi:MAG: polysaccharide deacetylase [Thermoleophilia bacterium]
MPRRLSRLALLSACASLAVPAAAAAPGDPGVPILMYHVIAEPPSGAPYPGLFVSPRLFRAQVRELARRGYRAVTLERVYAHWRRDRPLPRHPIVISFDDGYRSVYTQAFPILRSLRWPAVLNLETRHERLAWGLRPRWIRVLLAAGWELDAHSISHPDLTRVSDGRLAREVAGSRALLRRQFHVPVDFFAYPAGRYNRRVIAAVRAAGFLGAATTRYGLARPDELYTLARVRVDGNESAIALLAALRALGS